MPNVSGNKGDQSTNSGHGALGMGGDPGDLPRDLESGGGDIERREGTKSPVKGATGSAHGGGTIGGGSAGSETTGVMGDKRITGDVPSGPPAGDFARTHPPERDRNSNNNSDS